MKQFQKIAIGLLGLTNPEMFIPRPQQSATSTTKIEAAHGRDRGFLRGVMAEVSRTQHPGGQRHRRDPVTADQLGESVLVTERRGMHEFRVRAASLTSAVHAT